uniref:Uncharacterized protein n=1 Tax=Colobus angolensis palliatus TaxID=336983 RepID=A0A2K5JFD2_COLAP
MSLRPYLLGCLNFATSLNDSALERRAPRGSDRIVFSTLNMLPVLSQGGSLGAEGMRSCRCPESRSDHRQP